MIVYFLKLKSKSLMRNVYNYIEIKMLHKAIKALEPTYNQPWITFSADYFLKGERNIYEKGLKIIAEFQKIKSENQEIFIMHNCRRRCRCYFGSLIGSRFSGLLNFAGSGAAGSDSEICAPSRRVVSSIAI